MRRRRSARSLCGSGSSLAASLLSKPQIGQQERAAAVQGPSRHRDVRVHAQHDGQADDEYRLPESPRLPQRRAPLCEPEVSESKAGAVDLRNRPLPIVCLAAGIYFYRKVALPAVYIVWRCIDVEDKCTQTYKQSRLIIVTHLLGNAPSPLRHRRVLRSYCYTPSMVSFTSRPCSSCIHA